MDFSFTEDRRISVAPRTPKRRRKNFSDRGGGISPGVQSTTELDKFDILFIITLLQFTVEEQVGLQQLIEQNNLMIQSLQHETETQQIIEQINDYKNQIDDSRIDLEFSSRLSQTLEYIVFNAFRNMFIASNPIVEGGLADFRTINREQQEFIFDTEVNDARRERRHINFTRLLRENHIHLFSQDFVEEFLKPLMFSIKDIERDSRNDKKFKDILAKYQNFTIIKNAKKFKNEYIKGIKNGINFSNNENELLKIIKIFSQPASKKIANLLNNEFNYSGNDYNMFIGTINQHIAYNIILPPIQSILAGYGVIVPDSDDEAVEASDVDEIDLEAHEVIPDSDEEVVGSVDFGNYYDFDYEPESEYDDYY